MRNRLNLKKQNDAMKDSSHIVLVIGNGFDLDLGLKTSYKDFWNSPYCPKDYPAPIISHLNEKWSDNLNAVKWYDLENELLNYYVGIKDTHPHPDIFSNKELEFLQIANNMMIQYGTFKGYEEQVESLWKKGIIKRATPIPFPYIDYHDDVKHDSIWRDEKALRLIKEGLCKYLIEAWKDGPRVNTIAYNVLRCMSEAIEAEHTVNIYTFNYTPLPRPFDSIFEDNLFYVHGSSQSGSIIIGTRDGDYDEDYEFLQKAFDKHFSPPPIVADLMDADEVIFYGHSLGENDSQYLKPFFEKQSSTECKRKDITLFTYDEKAVRGLKRAINKMTGCKLSYFFSMNQAKIITQANDDRKEYNDFINAHISQDRINKVVNPLKYD